MTAVDLAIGPAITSSTELDDARWRQWQAKGRADDLRFRGRLRTVVIDVAAVIVIAGALWFAFVV